jgi:hypothetical protein
MVRAQPSAPRERSVARGWTVAAAGLSRWQAAIRFAIERVDHHWETCNGRQAPGDWQRRRRARRSTAPTLPPLRAFTLLGSVKAPASERALSLDDCSVWAFVRVEKQSYKNRTRRAAGRQ